jgi:hypothetical protein
VKWPASGEYLKPTVSQHAADRWAERIGSAGLLSALARSCLVRLDCGDTMAVYLDPLTNAAFVVAGKAGGWAVVVTVTAGVPARGGRVA